MLLRLFFPYVYRGSTSSGPLPESLSHPPRSSAQTQITNNFFIMLCFLVKWCCLFRPDRLSRRRQMRTGGSGDRKSRQSMATTFSSDRKKSVRRGLLLMKKAKAVNKLRAGTMPAACQALPFSAGANTLSCTAGLLTRPGCGAFPVFTSGSDCRILSCPRGAGLTAAGTVADSHGIPF